ncbi:hypothetical protein [Mycobacterium sp. E3339]|uniref:hypothetical protein n=1 Tax=Mycobacterium sp. E3339 TaxID=1834146 RepID=UPI000A42F2B8|nr:hypothetical protein [Mycobacterium sp. E3339]
MDDTIVSAFAEALHGGDTVASEGALAEKPKLLGFRPTTRTGLMAAKSRRRPRRQPCDRHIGFGCGRRDFTVARSASGGFTLGLAAACDHYRR